MTTRCINPQCPHPVNDEARDCCQGCQAQLRLGGRFRPVKLLGQGGFGRTFLAWDEAPSPPRRCVIKQIIRAQAARDRIWQEAERLVQLGQHPQIPELIAVLESSRDLCLVQDYIPGRNLEQVLQAEGPFTEAGVRSLLLSLLPVLQFIHDQGIIHRDIKPENILLPGDRPPVLVDFGAARSLPTATQTGTVIGSAGYAAPEQALGKAVPASDLYGLGVTCLHLLTGDPPFDLYSVLEDQWLWQASTLHPVSPALTRILNRLTARPLRSRYPSAAAALADLAPAGILPAAPASPVLASPQKAWRCLRTVPTPDRIANALALSPDGRAIATANSDATVQLWDLQGGLIHTFAQRFGFGSGHTDAVTAVEFHPNGRLLVTASQDGTVKQWDLQTYKLQSTLRPSGWPITAIALTPDGQMLLAGSGEGHITAWDLATGSAQWKLVRHAGAINDLALSPDGSRLASAGDDGTLRLWSLPEGTLLHTWTAPDATALCAVGFAMADPALVTGDAAGCVVLWNLLDFQQRTVLDRHRDAVSAIALTPDSSLLASSSRDQSVHLWTGAGDARQQIASLPHSWAVQDIAFTADGSMLVSSAADETIRFWRAAGA